jgi:hypothetical protein
MFPHGFRQHPFHILPNSGSESIAARSLISPRSLEESHSFARGTFACVASFALESSLKIIEDGRHSGSVEGDPSILATDRGGDSHEGVVVCIV